ncbi:MAG TPA: hypothetical protein VNU47_01770 [Candidatus Paceibacterota bacterium]|nr:hypothetical protein [Candidatus Paceibacterota bacterium]
MRSLLSGLFKKKGQGLPITTMFSKQSVARFCCHAVASAEGRVEAFDDHTVTTMPRNEQGGYDFCHACLGKMAIRCGWCERAIFIGDPVTLYMPSHPYVWFSPDVTFMSFDNQTVVGCGRTDCAHTGADYAGFWVPAGVKREGRWIAGVKPMISIYQTVLATNGAVVANDVSDMSEMPLLPGVRIPESLARA